MRATKSPTVVQVIDMFSGCGGMSYGFAKPGPTAIKFKLLGGLDVDPHANATYRKMLKRPAIAEDIRNLRQPARLKAALAEWGYDKKLPLLLVGCAPCQGFSSHRKKDKRIDGRNELLAAFADVALALKPDLVVMENVPEMLQDGHWEYFAEFRSRVSAQGYEVRARLHNLAEFGVPQERYRAVVLASRQAGRTAMPTPKFRTTEFATVRDAIADLPPLEAGGVDPQDPMHRTSRHRPETVKLLSLIPKNGGSRKSLPAGVGPSCHTRVDGFRDVYGRLWWDRPAVAITARCRTPSCGRYTHPEQDRGLSIREAALLQGFPRNFMFEGPFDDCYKQIGNAVSPIFAKALARHVAAQWHSMRQPEESGEDVIRPISKSISSALAGMKRQLRVRELADVG